MAGRALYIGVGAYSKYDEQLPTCANAAEAMKGCLQQDGDVSDPTRPRWDGKAGTNGPLLIGRSKRGATGGQLNECFDRFLESATSRNLLFYFAGHGRTGEFPQSVTSLSHGHDLLLCACDDDPQLVDAPQGLLFSQMLQKIGTARPRNATLILDCCDSGTAATMDFPPNVVLLAATDANRPALSWATDQDGYPLFTRLLLDGLNGAAKDARGWITALSLYAYAAGAMSPEKHGQKPTFKGHVSGLPVLHRVAGALSATDLQRLAKPITIHDDGRDIKMNPGFSGSKKTAWAEGDWEETKKLSKRPKRSRRSHLKHKKSPEQLNMDFYNRLIKAGLAETTHGKDLFWTVMDSIKEPGKHGVKLTSLGQYYYSLAKGGQTFDDDD